MQKIPSDEGAWVLMSINLRFWFSEANPILAQAFSA
jgi:hypothetical protein